MEDTVTNNNLNNLEENSDNRPLTANKPLNNKKTLQYLQINNADKILESLNEYSLRSKK